jgi:hypothetical protein
MYHLVFRIHALKMNVTLSHSRRGRAFCRSKMLPDGVSYQKIARALDIPVELVQWKALIISTPFSNKSD